MDFCLANLFPPNLTHPSYSRAFSEHVLFCVRVEKDEQSAHSHHVKATWHVGKEQVWGQLDIECERVKEQEAENDQGYGEVEVLEGVPELPHSISRDVL